MYKIKKEYIEEMMERHRYIKKYNDCNGTYETCNECLICDISKIIAGNASLGAIRGINESDMESRLNKVRLYRNGDSFKLYGFDSIRVNEYIGKIVENEVVCKL